MSLIIVTPVAPNPTTGQTIGELKNKQTFSLQLCICHRALKNDQSQCEKKEIQWVKVKYTTICSQEQNVWKVARVLLLHDSLNGALPGTIRK